MMRLTGRKAVKPAAAVATIQGLSRQRASHLHPPIGGLSAPTAQQTYPSLTKGKCRVFAPSALSSLLTNRNLNGPGGVAWGGLHAEHWTWAQNQLRLQV